MSKRHRSAAVLLLWLATASTAVHGQAVGDSMAERLLTHAYTLKHQRANEALELVRPLLTAKGTIKLQPGTNTLEIRDTAASVSRIVTVLRSFDHAARPLELEVMMVHASTLPVSPQVPSSNELPEDLLRRLRDLLRYDTFHLLARAGLEPREGEEAIYEIGEVYKVSFRLGTVLGGQRVKLHDFRVFRRDGQKDEELIHTNLNVWLDQTLTLGLARNEASRTALMVVLVCRNPERWTDAEGAKKRAAPPRKEKR